MKILFFTETLFLGGKERRILELIRYLKDHTDYTLGLVITEPFIHYEEVYELGITIKIIKRKFIKYDPLLFFKFFRYCRWFKPDIIHTWGRMTTFYSIPAKIFNKTPIISSMIADAKKDFNMFSLHALFHAADICFSDAILSNSEAGLNAYKINSSKAKVIVNGVNITRFQHEFETAKVREGMGITTEFVVVMVAAFSKNKDYDLFLDVAKEIGMIRDNVTFVGVGDGPEMAHIQRRIMDEDMKNVILTGKKNKVEPIIAASDIGLLCTFSEGISNSIIEYMALGKPVISTDITGGSSELIINGITGYCVERKSEKIGSLINLLLDDAGLRSSMGKLGRKRILSDFSIKKMGEDFNNLYMNILNKRVD